MKTDVTRAALVVVLAAAFSGCGSTEDGIERVPVSGSITLDGKPLSEGSIILSPIGDGPSSGGVVVDGSYSIPRPEGPAPGLYRVEVVSVQATGRKVTGVEGPRGTAVDERKNIIPDRYNARSELNAEVKKDGPNTFEFQLSSAPRKVEGKKRR